MRHLAILFVVIALSRADEGPDRGLLCPNVKTKPDFDLYRVRQQKCSSLSDINL